MQRGKCTTESMADPAEMFREIGENRGGAPASSGELEKEITRIQLPKEPAVSAATEHRGRIARK
jgi:hypothetical protein